MDEKRYVLAFCESYFDDWYKMRINRILKDPAEREREFDQFIWFDHWTGSMYEDYTYDEFVRVISRIDDDFNVGDVKFNTNKKFRHIKFITEAIEVLSDTIRLTRYQFIRNRRIILHQYEVDKSEFPTGFIYMTRFNHELQLFKSREDAHQYGLLNNTRPEFNIYVFNMTDAIGTGDPQDDSIEEEIRIRVKSANLKDVYRILMEYVGAEVDTYDSDGNFIYGIWSNCTTKSYKDFEDPDTCRDIQTWKYPLLWTH